jgi:L-threonylcarbamoyladenylate synthase
MFFKGNTINEVINTLKSGGIAIVPTDTIYGIICSAQNKKAVTKLYKVKQRDADKPCIILITNLNQIKSFGVDISSTQKDFFITYWPGAVSVILKCNTKKYEYLHKGIGSIAFRMIGKKNRNLYKIIEEVGPVLAPSANPQGMPPATCENKAKRYFGDRVDAYLCGGTRRSLPSTLVDYTGSKIKVVRQGKVNIK